MVSLGDNHNGNNAGAQFFRENNEEAPPLQPYDVPTSNKSREQPRPAIRQPYSQSNRHTTRTTLESNSNCLMPSNPIKFRHIFTGYFTIVEILIVVLYVSACYVDIIMFDTEQDIEDANILEVDKFSIYSIVHIVLWCLVGVFDRLIQWQHQLIRRRGYLRFYIKLKNVRRVPFGVFSTGNATIVLLFATRKQLETALEYTPFKFNYCLLILTGLELLITLPVLLYYIVITMRFNCKRPTPDATISGSSQSVLPFSSPPPDLGFTTDTDTHNVEELLDKQADMIRYLQFHNANLGRKIMELQNQTKH